MKKQNNIEDSFLQSLIKSDGLSKPSWDFTNKLMARLPIKNVEIEESSSLIGRNITLFIFILIGFINLLTIYLLWPYLSVWLPENSILLFIIDQANTLLHTYVTALFNRSATISLLLVIILGVTTIVGKDVINSWFYHSKHKAPIV